MEVTALFQPLFLAAFASLTPFVPQDSQAASPRNVAIVVYDGVELLDFAGPGEVFAAARDGNRRAFDVYTVARTKDPLQSQGFVEIVPEYTFADCPPPAIVVVPGGGVPLDDEELREWVVRQSKSAELVMSVCNGALVLAGAGLLDGLEVTTHAGSLEGLILLAPTAKVFANRRFVDHGKVLTCAGVSAGIDGSLAVVARLLGEETAAATASYMEYDWRPKELAALHAQPGVPPKGGEAYAIVASAGKQGFAQAAKAYCALANAPSESDLNRQGYFLLFSGKHEAAIDVFRFVAELFPTSSNAADSLSEAYEAAGRRDEGLAAAQRALELFASDTAIDPAGKARLHNGAASRIARLSGDGGKLRYTCAPCGRPCDSLGFVEAGQCPGCPHQLVERTPKAN